MNTNVRSTVQSLATEYGYGHRSNEIEAVANLVEQGQIGRVRSYLTALGVSSFTADRVQERLSQSFTGTAEPEVAETEGFDRETAAHVIRTFIQEGFDSNAAGRYSEEETTALLVLAGLEDEPEVEEPEVEEPTAETEEEDVDSMSAVVRRIEEAVSGLAQKVEGLVSFAQRHGYRG